MKTRVLRYEQFINEKIGMSDLFKSAHGSINKKDLKPLINLVDKPNFPTKKEFDEAVNFLKIDPNFLFYNKNDFLNRIIYWKGPVFYGFYGELNIQALKMFHADKYFEQMNEFVKEILAKKDYVSLFHRIEKKVLIPTFVEMYEDIPDDQKYDVFTDLYTRSEYGFQMFPIEIIKDCFSKRDLSDDYRIRMKELEDVIETDENGKVTVYRGENTGSSVSDDAFSWTLSKKTAKFFADRFNKGSGKISSKKIDQSEIIDYLSDRGESEVILFPKKFGIMKESVHDVFRNIVRKINKPSNSLKRPLEYVDTPTHIIKQEIPKTIVDTYEQWGRDIVTKGNVAYVSETGCKNSEKYVKIIRDDNYIS